MSVLYYLKSDEGRIFAELKRPEFKGHADKSLYVSWFDVTDEATRLDFVSMDAEKRVFKQGVLQNTGDKTYTFQPADGASSIAMYEADVTTANITADFVAKCFAL